MEKIKIYLGGHEITLQKSKRVDGKIFGAYQHFELDEVDSHCYKVEIAGVSNPDHPLLIGNITDICIKLNGTAIIGEDGNLYLYLLNEIEVEYNFLKIEGVEKYLVKQSIFEVDGDFKEKMLIFGETYIGISSEMNIETMYCFNEI